MDTQTNHRIPCAVDIVMPTRNRAALIAVAIESVLHSSYPHFTLWIVDQSDDTATEAALDPYLADGRIRYLRATSRGANFARNEGTAQGSAPVVAYIDDDCRVATDWLATLVAELAQPEVWAVFGRVIPDAATPTQGQADAQAVSLAIPMALKDSPARRIYEGNRFDLSFGHGANMGWRREHFLALGGFDGLIGAGGPLGTWDEKDAGYRALSHQGGRIIYTPTALVYHRHWRGWQEVYKAYRGYAIGTGAAAGKYLRCGDVGGLYLLWDWLLDQGVRQVLSGIIKWQSWQKVQVGLLQLIYPWVGLVQGLRYQIDRDHVIYLSK